MGLSASQGRLMMLTARRSDLEFKGQQINQLRMAISNSMTNLMLAQSTLEPDAPQTRQLQAQLQVIQQADKRLEMTLKTIDTQHKAVSTEEEAVKKIIDKNIQSSFKTFA